MTDEKALQTTTGGAVSTQAQDFDTLKTAIGGKDFSNSEVKLAVAYAESVGADLFARQIYPVKMDGRLQFLTSIDFLRVIAERSSKYGGQGTPVYGPDCDCQGEAMVVARKHPQWAEVPIYRKDWDLPVVRRAYYHEYLPTEGYRDDLKPKGTWVKMPHVLVAKVSEALGIRVAFPNDVRGMYTNDEMEQAGIEGATSVGQLAVEGGQAGVEIPDDPDQPEWAKHSINVREAPDGLRTVKVPDWYKGPGSDGKTIEKLEIKGKYGRRNVTVILLGTPAVFADAQISLLTEGTEIVLDGVKYEFEWQQGKPKALQIRNATRLAVNMGSEYLDVERGPAEREPDHPAEMPEDVIEGQAVEVPPEEPPPPPEPTPAPEPKAPKAPKAPSAAPSSTTATATTSTDPSSSEPGPTTPTSGDVTAAAAETFGDLMDADVDPARGGNPQVGEAWEGLPLLDGPNGQAVSLEGYYAKGELVDVPHAPGKTMFDGWVTSSDMKHRIHVLMSAQVAKTAGVERLGAGEEVYVRGAWRRPGDMPVILADTLRPS